MYKSLFIKSGLSLDRLNTLVEVDVAGRISKAAGADPVRQSQYSRQIRELETFFECKLAERRGRCMALTPAGKRLALLTRQHFQALSSFAAECRHEKIAVRIGAGAGTIQWLLIPRLNAIISQQRDIKIRFNNLRTNDIVNRLCTYQLEFGLIRRASRVSAPLKYARLGKIGYSLFIPKTLLGTVKLQLPRILSVVPLAVLNEESLINKALYEISLPGHSTLDIRYQCSSLAEIAGLIAEKQAAGIIPSTAGTAFNRSDVITVPLDRYKGFSDDLVLAWNSRTIEMSDGLDKLKDVLTEVLRK